MVGEGQSGEGRAQGAAVGALRAGDIQPVLMTGPQGLRKEEVEAGLDHRLAVGLEINHLLIATRPVAPMGSR